MVNRYVRRDSVEIKIPSGWRELNSEVEFIEAEDKFYSPGGRSFMLCTDDDIGGLTDDYVLVIRKEKS